MFDPTTFAQIIDHTKKTRVLESVLELLSWDQETMMPSAANNHRTEQNALLSGLIHDLKQSQELYENVQRLMASFQDDQSDQSVIIKRLSRDIEIARKLPTPFVQLLTRTTSEAFCMWQRAKTENDWELFRPNLQSIVDLSRKKADYLGYTDHPYDALLDMYEPGAKTADIATLFSSLKQKLQLLLHEVQRSPLYGKKSAPISSSLSDQIRVSREVLSFIGYDWTKSRLDTSEHPFSTGIHPTDTRITIRQGFDHLIDQVMSALHEGGHGLYDMGLSQKFYGTPISEAASHSIHESQSRFWETIIGRSKNFMPHLFTIMSRILQERNCYKNIDDLYADVNRVECSFIRTQADELTYPLHVILRFEIEKELIEGSLDVKDVPERWNDGMIDSLGIIPPTYKDGCLQDVHWSLGYFGYFPTYTLGSLYAICFSTAMSQSLPNYDTLLKKGNYAPIHAWLNEHVWKHGRRYLSHELVTKALGRAPTEDDYIQYLRNKFMPQPSSSL
jgi:carboxypeptidase Taq